MADVFTLEALEAKYGDSLLLHYGDHTDPRLIVIDGGPAAVYKAALRPRLPWPVAGRKRAGARRTGAAWSGQASTHALQ